MKKVKPSCKATVSVYFPLRKPKFSNLNFIPICLGIASTKIQESQNRKQLFILRPMQYILVYDQLFSLWYFSTTATVLSGNEVQNVKFGSSLRNFAFLHTKKENAIRFPLICVTEPIFCF